MLTGEATINGNVDLPIAPSAKIPSDLFVKWVLNDDGSIPFIIPTNTYILEEKKSIKDVERVPFTVKFQNLSIIEGPAYLPLKVVLYDTQGNEYPTDTTVFIAITTKTTYPNDWVEGSNNSVTPSGTKITLAGGQFSSDILDRGQNFDNAIDGNEATFAQIKTNRNSTALDFVFTE